MRRPAVSRERPFLARQDIAGHDSCHRIIVRSSGIGYAFGQRSSVLSLISLHLPSHLRSPRNAAAVAIGAAAFAGIAWYALRRPRPSAEEIERERRELLASIGRITDGSITDAPVRQADTDAEPLVIVYNYRIAGVTYECAQDVTSLAEHVRDVRADLPVQVRYDMHNPGNSIVVSESWSGLRLSPHPHDSETE